MIVLEVSVETSDQMGTSESFVVGVFRDDAEVEYAKKAVDALIRTRRVSFTVYDDLGVNVINIPQKWRS
jgi:hypothetical protein